VHSLQTLGEGVRFEKIPPRVGSIPVKNRMRSMVPACWESVLPGSSSGEGGSMGRVFKRRMARRKNVASFKKTGNSGRHPKAPIHPTN
jgi:hypothetical protein